MKGNPTLGGFFQRQPRAEVKSIQEELLYRLTYKPKYVCNFVMSQNQRVCCFLGKVLYITDENLKPLVTHTFSSHICGCSISDKCRYVAAQLAHNESNNHESGAFVLVDIWKNQIIAEQCIEVSFKIQSHIYIDEKEQAIYIYPRDESPVRYDFSLQAERNSLKVYYDSPNRNPYSLLGRATYLLSKPEDFKDTAEEIRQLLARAKASEKVSEYQLSLAYKTLGEQYETAGEKESALQSYETGLSLNPHLSVKKRIKQLKEP